MNLRGLIYRREKFARLIATLGHPGRPKIGDGLYYQGNRFLDDGYRGYGIFEENNYESMPCNAMIAWIGNVHLTEDPLCANYCHSGIIDANGNVVHGIAQLYGLPPE